MAKKKNHHLERIGDVWYLIAMCRGKRIKKALASSVMEARRLRDEYLDEIRITGDIQKVEPSTVGILFGEVITNWAKKKVKRVKPSSWRDYRSIVNNHILPRFGNHPIVDITCDDIEDFIDGLGCGNKRKNNIMVPIRSVFQYALRGGFVEKNIMLEVDNLNPEETDIRPLDINEVRSMLEQVHPHYRNFFEVAFFTGMRFGEMAALKWKNVDLGRSIIRVVETRVYGREGSPKTKKSKRDIELIGPVLHALNTQHLITGKGLYVFRDIKSELVTPDHMRNVIWKPALRKADIEYRPMLQTRHTFATMMLDAGEDIGWVMNQLGHASLQMIFTRYYSWIKKTTRNDGSAFMKNMYEKSSGIKEEPAEQPVEKLLNFTPNLPQAKKKDLGQKAISP